MTNTRVDIKTPDGVMDARAIQPAATGRWPAVIMYMDAPGIRPGLVSMAERLASNGYYVLLPNLYYRSGPQAPLDPAIAFQEGPERQRMFALYQSINQTLVARDTAACLDFLSTQPAVDGPKVGCVGYCMGGGFALTAAGRHPDRVAAVGAFHAARLATDQPDSPHLLAPKMRASLYIGVAGIDPHFSDEERERLRAALQQAGAKFELEVYPDVRHGFAVSDVPVYDKDASERHWDCLLRLLRGSLSGETATAV
jgi:carboxymethylenebutenolidase